MEKTFGNGIIETITFTAHTLNNMMVIQNFPMAVGSILTSSISIVRKKYDNNGGQEGKKIKVLPRQYFSEGQSNRRSIGFI